MGDIHLKCIVVDNIILYKTPNGNYYAPSIYSYDFFRRYLAVFNQVKIVAKVKTINENDVQGMSLVSGQGLEIVDIPWYHGFSEMKKEFSTLLRIYRHVAEDCEVGIYRIAQFESFMVYMFAKKKKSFRYAVEVVNDPETFVDMPVWMKRFSVLMVRRMTGRADGASYVTQKFLQSKYPDKKRNHFESFYSSIDLSEDDIVKGPKKYIPGTTFRIIHVSNAINSDIKGHTTLIKAFETVCKNVSNVELYIVGDGDLLQQYKDLVRRKGLEGKVKFTGRLNSKDEIYNLLRSMNLMVLPTKMEGLPRTIIEAMACGLPCVSTPIAGIPELLNSKYLFNPDDDKGFAKEIIRLIDSPEELYEMSSKNIEKSHKYSKRILDQRRNKFYHDLANCR